ncbi:MAG: hypothetical protein H0V17_30485, partial [Deltaproteobacteria bacterium]|nr:hypothetical protein [Deltaproteobacteria bacterium]
YLIARRQGDEARFLAGAAGLTDTSQIDFALRDYKKLAASTTSGWRIPAKVVLDEPVPEAELAQYQPLERAVYEIARALERSDQQAARAITERVWADHVTGKFMTSPDFYVLEYFGEVLVAGGMKDEARRLVKLLADHSKRRQKRGYHRLSNLTAALTKDASLVVRGGTVRNARLADAAEAEIAGDHAKAAALLLELVANPSPTWDYPERAMLIRNLRAIPKRDDEVAKICNDTLEPAMYRHAFPVVRATCRKR